MSTGQYRNKTSHRYRKRLTLLVGFYLLGLLAIVCLPYWPSPLWVPASFISFLPVWMLLIPAIILAPFCFFWRDYDLLATLALSLVLGIKISGWVFNPQDIQNNQTSINNLTVISANMGENASVEQLNQLIVDNNADLIALQEVKPNQLDAMLKESPLNAVCEDQLCLLSHLSLKKIEAKAKTLLQSKGDYGLKVQVTLPIQGSKLKAQQFNFYVLHLETPRRAFKAFMTNPFSGWRDLADVIDGLSAQSWIASSWVAKGKLAIAAGGFSLPRNHPVYHKYWQWMNDNFAMSGIGLGYTKNTRLSGVQIDHIMSAPDWKPIKTWIGPSLGGDHLPIISELVL